MKLRLISILLLFVLSAGILAWLYYAATSSPRRTTESPWSETIADLDACSRRKHVKSLQYDRFAGIAGNENRPGAARLFRAMAFSERLQEQNCAAAIRHLGSSYTPPGKVVVFDGTTDGNLERSIDYERKNFSDRRGAEIRRALEKGNRYVARALIWASANDRRNITLMEYCRRSTAGDSLRFAVCPVCGCLYATQFEDYYCPFCLTDGRRFIRFE